MNPSKNVVLLVTHSGDYFTVDRVAEALVKRGVQPFRFDSDRFPLQVQLSARLSNQGLNHWLKDGDRSVNVKAVRSVWMRHIWQPQLALELAPRFREACARESTAALYGFLDSLKTVFWLDHLQSIEEAENKLRQLRIASEVGLKIPSTLVTNCPQEAREFFQELKGKVVAKLLTPLSYGMESSSFFLYTSSVKAEDLFEADALRHCPMVFQAEIPKRRELRIAFVGGQFFAGALESAQYSTKTLDWRSANPGDCTWEAVELPSPIANDLIVFMKRLGLGFGAIDMIETPQGEYIFLEVNPTGEWGMLERDLDYPISEAIADTLCKGSKP